MRPVRVAAWAALVMAVGGLMAAASGCSTVFDIESDRYVVATDAGPDAVVTGDFSCAADPEPTPAAGPLELKLYVNDIASVSSANHFVGTPVAGAQVRACGKLDVTCGTPLSASTADDAGIALLSVPSGFDGYCEVTAEGFTPALATRGEVFDSEYVVQAIANVALIATGGALAGVKSDPSLATAIVSVLDCAGVPSPGVVFDIGAPTAEETLVYLEQTLPSASATATDSTGSAIIYNVPSGTLSLTARFASDGRPIRSVTTLARQGWVTFVQIQLDQTRRTPL